MPGAAERGAHVYHAADDTLDGNRRSDPAAGIDALERSRTECGDAGAEPPGHAVHRRQHHGIGADERGECGCERWQRRALQRDDDEILGAELARIIRGQRERRLQERRALPQAPAVIAQRHERRAACEG